MNGLLNQQPAAQDVQPEQGMDQDPPIDATPEEQQMYEQYVRAALGEVLGNGEAFKAMMQTLEAARNNPVDSVARIALALYEKAEKKLGPLEDDDTTEAVGEAIIEALLDMAQEGGVLADEQVNEELAAAIYTKLAQLWIEQNPERADPADVQYIESQKGGAA